MHEVWDEYWAALGRGDRHAALAVVRRVEETGADPLKVIDGLIIPAQEMIGELWLAGEWSIAQEHAATAINQSLVHWLGTFAAPPPPDAPLVLVSCLEQEQHGFPALVVAEALRLAGYRVTYLGTDPEPTDLLRYVVAMQPRAVLFSASLTSTLAVQKPLLSHIRAIGIPVIVGGRAFGGNARRAEALGATAYAHGVDDVLRLMSELPERTEPALLSSVGEADDEAAWLSEYRSEITPYVVRAISHRHQQDGERPLWWADFESHMDHMVGSLAAAVATRDESIMVEARDWLTLVLTRRGAHADLVDEIWELLAEPLRGHALAQFYLSGASLPYAVEDALA